MSAVRWKPRDDRPGFSSIRNGATILSCVLAASLATADSQAQAVMSQPVDPSVASKSHDEFSWLEDRHGEAAMAWVQRQNQRTLGLLTADSCFRDNYRKALAVSGVRNGDIATKWMIQGWVHQILKTPAHPLGIWRRARLPSYVSGRPRWQVLLDVDEMSRRDGRDYNVQLGLVACQVHGSRCMVPIQVGQSPRVGEFREFDLATRDFVKGGFDLPQDKALIRTATWDGPNALIVTADFGAGSLDKFDAPTVLKRWKRGQPISKAEDVLRIPVDPASRSLVQPPISLGSDSDGKPNYLFRAVYKFDTWKYWIKTSEGGLVEAHLPQDAYVVGVVNSEIVVQLAHESWSDGQRVWPAGSVISFSSDEALRSHPRPQTVIAASENAIVGIPYISGGRVLAPVRNRLRNELWLVANSGGHWQQPKVAFHQTNAILGWMLADGQDNTAIVATSGYLSPPSEYAIGPAGRARRISRPPSSFNDTTDIVEIAWARSADGEEIPYTLVRPRQLSLNGEAPTIIYAYGAAGTVEDPRYDPVLGRLWLEKGGLYVFAHVRGGGELGPRWAVTPVHRNLTDDDMKAVAEDLIRRRITTPEHMGIWGHSAGGYLMGVMVTLYPDLFHAAVISGAPLDAFRADLDPLGAPRLHAVLGDPSIPTERKLLEQTSPFQNLGHMTDFPTPFILTSTTDDNVNPAWPRRFAAKAERLGLPFFYFENAEGGHGYGMTAKQQSTSYALIYTYFARRLMAGPRPGCDNGNQ